ncbi:MAG TPA: hypothetical protein VLA74_09090 [Nitrososphaeraceae archaeon]|nr:hypothetical protein [Nitrososphaeraceae archaeon]
MSKTIHTPPNPDQRYDLICDRKDNIILSKNHVKYDSQTTGPIVILVLKLDSLEKVKIR